MLKYFYVSGTIAVAGLLGAYFYGGWSGVVIAAVLTLMEVSLSFDNAIMNATVLKDMAPKWQQRFLTWGIFIAVFGMRLLFPLTLVSFVTDLNLGEVLKLALNEPETYSAHLLSGHASISAFGGMFLLMVFLTFILDHKRDIYWLGELERRVGQVGNLESIQVILGLIILLVIQNFAVQDHRITVLVSGIAGLSTYVIIHSLSKLMNQHFIETKTGDQIKNTGFMSFVYLEVLDASFSFDGVIGAFAITKDIVIIMIGLGIGAFFVRSLTILLVQKRTLQNYIYLEHGAHYALGALAIMMLMSIFYTIPEVVIGSIGFVLIALSYYSSVVSNKKNKI
jgi:hypothetical protein